MTLKCDVEKIIFMGLGGILHLKEHNINLDERMITSNLQYRNRSVGYSLSIAINIYILILLLLYL